MLAQIILPSTGERLAQLGTQLGQNLGGLVSAIRGGQEKAQFEQFILQNPQFGQALADAQRQLEAQFEVQRAQARETATEKVQEAADAAERVAIGTEAAQLGAAPPNVLGPLFNQREIEGLKRLFPGPSAVEIARARQQVAEATEAAIGAEERIRRGVPITEAQQTQAEALQGILVAQFGQQEAALNQAFVDTLIQQTNSPNAEEARFAKQALERFAFPAATEERQQLFDNALTVRRLNLDEALAQLQAAETQQDILSSQIGVQAKLFDLEAEAARDLQEAINEGDDLRRDAAVERINSISILKAATIPGTAELEVIRQEGLFRDRFEVQVKPPTRLDLNDRVLWAQAVQKAARQPDIQTSRETIQGDPVLGPWFDGLSSSEKTELLKQASDAQQVSLERERGELPAVPEPGRRGTPTEERAQAGGLGLGEIPEGGLPPLGEQVRQVATRASRSLQLARLQPSALTINAVLRGIEGVPSEQLNVLPFDEAFQSRVAMLRLDEGLTVQEAVRRAFEERNQ